MTFPHQLGALYQIECGLEYGLRTLILPEINIKAVIGIADSSIGFNYPRHCDAPSIMQLLLYLHTMTRENPSSGVCGKPDAA